MGVGIKRQWEGPHGHASDLNFVYSGGGTISHVLKLHWILGHLGGSVGQASDFGLGHDLTFMGLRPALGSVLTVQGLEPASNSVSASL